MKNTGNSWKIMGQYMENHERKHWKFMKKAMEITILSSVSLAKATNEFNGEH